MNKKKAKAKKKPKILVRASEDKTGTQHVELVIEDSPQHLPAPITEETPVEQLPAPQRNWFRKLFG